MQHRFSDLLRVMAVLRGEDGCPWDREQDHHSLKRYLLEETHEVLAAIDAGDDLSLAEELGDLLLQIVFHSQIAEEGGRFTIDDVIHGITEKLIRRHPHVFGTEEAPDAEAVAVVWERIKQEERRGQHGEGAADDAAPSVLDGLTPGLPALMYAYDVQRRAARVGFDWSDAGGAWEKVIEEINEVAEAKQTDGPSDSPGGETTDDRLAEEWGDLFFALINAARHDGVYPEEVLNQATRKFVTRFRHVEAKAAQSGRSVQTMSLEDMDALWDEVKKEEEP